MLFTLNNMIFLVERRDNLLVRHDRTANCKHAYSFSKLAGEVLFRQTPLSIHIAKPIPKYVFSNKGIRELGWLAFSKLSDKLVLIVDWRNEYSYGIVFYDNPSGCEIGSVCSISSSCLERAPDDFQFCLELGETRDYAKESK